MYYSQHIRIHLPGIDARSVSTSIQNGTISIVGGKKKEKIRVEHGKVASHKQIVDGKCTYWIEYGKFMKRKTKHGREIIEFRPGTGTGKHGKAVLYSTLFGHHVKVESHFSRGRLMRQKATYKNGTIAYFAKIGSKECAVYNRNKTMLYKISSEQGLFFRIRGHQLFTSEKCFMPGYLNDAISSKTYTINKFAKNKLVYGGEVKNRQKDGKWIEDGIEIQYDKGIEIPKMYLKEDLDVQDILNCDNAQLRASLISKTGLATIVAKAKGKVVHKQKDNEGNVMELISIPVRPAKDIERSFGNAHFRDEDTSWGTKADKEIRILKVICPSTKSTYCLPVDPRATKCEQARQWTFGVPLNAPRSRWIQFIKET